MAVVTEVRLSAPSLGARRGGIFWTLFYYRVSTSSQVCRFRPRWRNSYLSLRLFEESFPRPPPRRLQSTLQTRGEPMAKG